MTSVLQIVDQVKMKVCERNYQGNIFLCATSLKFLMLSTLCHLIFIPRIIFMLKTS